MVQRSVIRLSMIEPDIALLTLDDPEKSANILSRHVLDELSSHLDEIEKRDDLAGLIICSAKPGMFIAGADLREFASSLNMPTTETVELCTRGRKLFQRLSQCPCVTVVAIDGICVGGGAELACWCDRRIMTNDPRCTIGFPEVKLGLYPGWGGTARSTRIIGLANAVTMVTSGESIDSQQAYAMGLAWDIVTSDRLLESAVRLVRIEQESKDYLADRERWSQGVTISDNELGFLGATGSAFIQGQTKGHYPAPMAALELMLESAGLDISAACEMEAQGMAQLWGTPVNRSLINVFFLGDRNKKDTGVSGTPPAVPEVHSVSVIGAGIMGQGIAAACLKRKVLVSLTDAADEATKRGVRQVLEEVSYNKKTKKPDIERMARFAPLLNPTQSDQEVANADVVIEAVVENAEIKKSVFARLEPLLGEQSILASNTSTIPITQLAAGLKNPDRFCGIHFFNPVRKMPLVEIIRGPQTSDETIVTAVEFAKKIGKSPIVVNDGPGFLVNRLLLPYMNEAVALLTEGVPMQKIEKAAKKFGMPMGPLTLYDVVGLDTAFYAGRVMWEAFPDRIVPQQILATMVKQGRLGQKSGAGFFKYGGKGRRGEHDPDFDVLLKKYCQSESDLSTEQTIARLFLPMLLEATRLLEEDIVRDYRDVDLGLIYGLGFPPFKGGLFFWADTIGAAKIVEMLKPWEHLGPRLQPTALLLEMAKHNRTFYGV